MSRCARSIRYIGPLPKTFSYRITNNIHIYNNITFKQMFPSSVMSVRKRLARNKYYTNKETRSYF